MRSTSGSSALGEQFQKPVVATCDVHFLNPEDEVYRRIIMASKGFSDADDQAPLYLADHGGNAGGILRIWAARKRKRWSSPTRKKIADMV